MSKIINLNVQLAKEIRKAIKTKRNSGVITLQNAYGNVI